MNKETRYILALLFSILSTVVFAQFGNQCIDTNRINPFYQCGANPNFSPVCGCDGKTYVNGCFAYNQGGVNTIQYSGVCQNDLFLSAAWPNPINDYLNFYIRFADKKSQDATIQIYNMQGNQVYYKLLKQVPTEEHYVETIYFAGLKTGVYVMLVIAGDKVQSKKFIKYSIR